jgi:hypothetical protein
MQKILLQNQQAAEAAKIQSMAPYANNELYQIKEEGGGLTGTEGFMSSSAVLSSDNSARKYYQ